MVILIAFQSSIFNIFYISNADLTTQKIRKSVKFRRMMRRPRSREILRTGKKCSANCIAHGRSSKEANSCNLRRNIAWIYECTRQVVRVVRVVRVVN